MNEFTATTAISLSLFVATAAGQTSFSWATAQNGNWGTAANWSPNGVPSFSDTATLGLATPYIVTVNANRNVGTLSLENPDARLDIRAGRGLTIWGGASGDSTILVNSQGGNSATFLQLGANTVFSDGTVQLNSQPGQNLNTAYLQSLDNDQPPTIGVGATVTGRGELLGTFINNGTILADGQDDFLNLRLTGFLSQSATGLIEAKNSGAVAIRGYTAGGTIDSSDPLGFVYAVRGVTSTFDSLTALGGIGVEGGATLRYLNVDHADATTLVNFNGVNSATALQLGANEVVNGGMIELNSQPGQNLNTAFIQSLDNDQPPTIGVGATVTGRGELLGTFINNGTILADGQDDFLNLRLTGFLSQSATGLIEAKNSGAVAIRGYTAGGTIDSSDPLGFVYAVRGVTSTFDSLTALGGIGVEGGATLRYLNVDHADATTLVNFNGVNSATALQLGANEVVNGGMIELNSQPGQNLNTAYLQSLDNNQPPTIGAGATVTGRGELLGNFYNNGKIIADGADDFLTLRLTNFLTQSENASIVAKNSGAVALQGYITGGTIDSGADPLGFIYAVRNQTTTFDGSTVLGNIGLDGGATLRYLNVDHADATTLVNFNGVNSATALQLGANEVLNGGTVILNATPGLDLNQATLQSLDNSQPATIGENATVTGRGDLAGNMTVAGRIAPGLTTDPTEYIRVINSLAFTPSSELHIELQGYGAGEADQIGAKQTVALGGTLRVTAIDDFEPQIVSRWTVLFADQITGEFDDFVYEGTLPEGAFARVFYDYPNARVDFVVTCAADGAPPAGVLDLADINAFVNAFLAQSELADLAAPFGVLDLSDINTFVTTFQSNCGQDP